MLKRYGLSIDRSVSLKDTISSFLAYLVIFITLTIYLDGGGGLIFMYQTTL